MGAMLTSSRIALRRLCCDGVSIPLFGRRQIAKGPKLF